ncbi:MAG: hypothetical protein ACXVHM_08520 [Methanobacterium sp.]
MQIKKIIGTIIILILAFSIIDVVSAANILGSKGSGWTLGSKSYGWVEKETYGNQSSDKTIVIITGVHPREGEFHKVIAAALKDKSPGLSRKYIIYKIHVTQSPMDFTLGRVYGQLVANDFVVPDILKINPKLVVDIHEDSGEYVGYKYIRFIYPISSGNKTSAYIKNFLENIPYLSLYSPGGTSPSYVTKPIANEGIPSFVYETYAYDAYDKKYSDASQLIDNLDKMPVI